ncbi:MAG TPA: hypothetical protein VFH00_14110 [Candidatus Nitrosotalea sp.]|nr:hypothetical protein [Candidatus Nitrosotalea sp.]
MLAYVYFHRAGPGVETPPYEAALLRFHASLASKPPPGFISSTTYRIGSGYADWYLVDSSAALDLLNEAAVDRARSAPHDAVALLSADGAGKLLMLRSGSARPQPGFEIRFSKPAGTTYRELYERLKPWTDRAEVSLWRRMMVLGPAPEFCLVAPSQLDLPDEMRPETLQREPI